MEAYLTRGWYCHDKREQRYRFSFWNACDFKSAYLLVKQAMEKVEGLASDELWQKLDEVAMELKQKCEEKKADPLL